MEIVNVVVSDIYAVSPDLIETSPFALIFIVPISPIKSIYVNVPETADDGRNPIGIFPTDVVVFSK